MSLTTAELAMVTDQIRGLLRGGEIVRIDQPDQWRIIFHIRRDAARYWLQLVAHPDFSRLHLLTARPRRQAPAAGFCNLLRQHLTGSPITDITRIEGERVVELHLQKRDALLQPQPLRLVAELTGRRSNLVLVDASGAIIGALHAGHFGTRDVIAGRPYRYPPPPPGGTDPHAAENRFTPHARPEDDALSLSRAIIQHYERAEEQALLDTRRRELGKRLGRGRKRLERMRTNIRADLAEAEKSDDLRRKGELLKIALPEIVKGQSSVTVKDFFSEGAPEKRIELNPHLSPQENIERLFRRYKRLSASIAHLRKRLAQAEAEADELEKLTVSFHNIRTLRELEEFERSLPAGKPAGAAPKGGIGKKAPKSGGPRRFYSAAGFEILVARNRKEGHHLTFSMARGNDCWMHLLGHPGPHVIIRRPKGSEIPADTLLDAAHLAVHYSKIRGARFVRVVHTLCKHVKPARGAAPGTVHYSGESTIGVRFDKARLAAALGRGRETP